MINDLEELRNIVVKNINGTPILVKNLADVHESCLPRLGQVGPCELLVMTSPPTLMLLLAIAS